MKNNIKILGIQFFTIILIGCVIEFIFDLPDWVSFIIGAAFFWTVFMIMQIKAAIDYPCDDVSKDGISGARLTGIMITSWITPFVLGLYKHVIVDIFFVILGIVAIFVSRKYFFKFLLENNWKKMYWLVYGGCVSIINGIYSLFAVKDLAPCTVLSYKYRIIALFLFGGVFLISIPPNSPLAKFATKNYERNKSQ